MQMIQLQNYRQWDVRLQADLWLFLGKSSKPPLLLSPVLEIIREYIPFLNLFIFCYECILAPPSPARRERSRSSQDSCPAPQGCAAARAGRQPGVPAVPGHTYARKGKPDPDSLSHLLGGFAPTHAGAWTTACCCRCYFLSVFLDIYTSSLHPQDGFQASVLFPMATKTQPGNLNPLARPSHRQGRWWGAPASSGWSLQLVTKLF